MEQITTLAEQRAAQLRALAGVVRDNVNAREEIAQGFELIAAAMAPCEDCGHPDADAAHAGGFDPNADTTGTA